MGVSIRGLQEAQRATLQVVAAMQPGAIGRAVIFATTETQRYEVAITHVDSGSLRASEHVAYQDGNLRGTVYLDPNAVNPRTNQRPAVYGPFEQARGAAHAFQSRTYFEAGPRIVQEAGRMIERSLP